MPDIWRCLSCANEIDAEKLPSEGISGCPNCGCTGIPIRPAEAVDVKVTWHELRVLVMWAERHASQYAKEDPHMPRVVRTIAAFLGAQHPELASKSPLTFLGEIEQVREVFGPGNVQQNVVTEKESPNEGVDPT